jgi:hypothetical protein
MERGTPWCPRTHWFAAGLLLAGVAPLARAQDAGVHAPSALVPFEHLIGTWKGVGIPSGNKLKGWQETHVYGWSFDKGQPVALTLEFTGSKLIAQGKLRAEGTEYVVEGVDPDDGPVRWKGTFDESAQTPTLTLTPDAPPGDGPARRLVVRLLSNKEGYTFWDERKTGTRFSRSVEVIMSRNDPTIGASRGSSNKPKCIITGGEATIQVSYQGRSYPVCCTGCRDEFLAEPEKYLAKLAKKAAAAGESAPEPAPEKTAETTSKTRKQVETKDEKPGAPTPKPAADKAAELLKRAQDLEKAGNKSAALIYYQRVVKEFAQTPQAKTAAQRVKALGEK